MAKTLPRSIRSLTNTQGHTYDAFRATGSKVIELMRLELCFASAVPKTSKEQSDQGFFRAGKAQTFSLVAQAGAGISFTAA